MMVCGDDGMGWDGNGFAWYGGMGFLFFLLVLHDTLFALRLRYTIEAVHVVVYFLVFISLFAARLWSLPQDSVASGPSR
jgi:hypothetical protein